MDIQSAVAASSTDPFLNVVVYFNVNSTPEHSQGRRLQVVVQSGAMFECEIGLSEIDEAQLCQCLTRFCRIGNDECNFNTEWGDFELSIRHSDNSEYILLDLRVRVHVQPAQEPEAKVTYDCELTAVRTDSTWPSKLLALID